MKIIVLPSWYPPEGGEFFAQQAHALARLGHRVTVCSAHATTLRNPLQWLKALLGLSRGPRLLQEGPIHLVSLRYPTFPFWRRAKLELYVGFLRWCVKRAVAVHGAPDVVHVHSAIWAGVAAARLRHARGYPYLITEHRSRFVDNRFVSPRDRREMLSPHTRKALASASRIAAVSRSMLPALQRISGLTADRFTVVPNMVDVDFFQPARTGRTRTGPFRFFSLANLVPLKGFLNLIDAFAQVVNKHSAELMIGGEGPQRMLLEERIHQLRLSNYIHLLGQLSPDQVRDQMEIACAFVLASTYEAFGVVLIEAMAMGLPLIGTRSGGPEDIITPNVGFLVNVSDVDDIASKMLRMITEHEQFKSKTIAKRARDLYSEKVIADRLTAEFLNVTT